MDKRIALIGSTGSIGRQVLEVVKGLTGFSVCSLVANVSKELLEEQIVEFNPSVACLTGLSQPPSAPSGVRTYCGEDSFVEAITDDADIVFVAVTGFAGLKVVLEAIKRKKNVALANKEALVCAGESVMKLARENGVEIIPVDSEHSALWQALNCKKQGYKRLILTASGGPFRQANLCDMRHFTAKDALKHPNWSMGNKITIDCATMLNKGFEVIEAHHLFSAPLDCIDVVVHPQSIIHSMVEFEDNSVMAEMSNPDMRQPIQFALTYPNKLPLNLKPLDFAKLGRLEFYPLDREKFPCFDIAIESLKMGNNFPCAMNGSSEVAVNAFLKDEIKLTDIAKVIAYVLKNIEPTGVDYPSLEYTDGKARALAKEFIKKIIGNN